MRRFQQTKGDFRMLYEKVSADHWRFQDVMWEDFDRLREISGFYVIGFR